MRSGIQFLIEIKVLQGRSDFHDSIDVYIRKVKLNLCITKYTITIIHA